jgi:hypothetical protein
MTGAWNSPIRPIGSANDALFDTYYSDGYSRHDVDGSVREEHTENLTPTRLYTS